MKLVIALLALSLAAPAAAKTTKVQHAAVVAPAWVGDAVTPDVGTITAMVEHGGTLYVGGQKGLAAVGTDGSTKWTIALPDAMVRNLSVDDSGVAWTGWTLAGVSASPEGFAKWAMGSGLSDKLDVADSRMGFVGLDGVEKWSVEASKQEPLSPPGISPISVGVLLGRTFVALDKTDGHVLNTAEGYVADMPAYEAFYDHATRGFVVPIGDAFFTSYLGIFMKLSFDGKLIDKEAMAGLTPYVNVTCGPVQLGDLLVFGTTGDTNVESAFFAMKPDMKNAWKEWSPDENSGCGALVRDGDHLVLASNFYVAALDKKGKILWQSVNKKGGMYPSSKRGIRYIRWFGVRKTYGDLVVAGGGHVFVGADNGGDVITELDGGTGAYVRTWDVKQPLVAMQWVDGKLAVATETEVRFLKAD